MIVLVVCGIEVGVGMFVMRDLLMSSIEVQQMYDVSVLGLRRIGELQYEAQETRRSTLYALTTNNAHLQIEYADQSRQADNRVTAGITQYMSQGRGPRELELGKRLSNDWSEYLEIRNEVLGSILAGSIKEGVSLDLAAGVPAFDRVRQDLEEIKRLYDEQASQRVVLVSESSRRSAVKLICGLGLALLFGSLAVWAIQRNRVRNALELARLRMDFVASVSHELRTPITAILSAGENIRDGLVEKQENLIEQGSIVTRQAIHLIELVDQVLQFSASTEAKPWQALRPLQVSEIIEYALRNTAAVLQEAGFTVERNLQPGLPNVWGDLSALSLCLQNLITNAVKYSNGQRWIGISARSERTNHQVLISVEDHGIGIDGSDLPHIFEPFYRSPRAVAAQIHGTGLGLSIAKQSADLCGGSLSITSEVGVGSIFTIHLPLPEQDVQQITVTSGTDLGIDL